MHFKRNAPEYTELRMQVAQRIRGAVSSKQYGFEDLLCPLIAQACIDVCPKNPNNFNVDNVRVIKITGSGAYNSSVVKGIVIKRDTEGTVKGVTDAKVAVFAQGVDTSSTETKVQSLHLATVTPFAYSSAIP